MDATTDTVRVLHVDDDEAFVEMAAELLEREDEAFVVETATGVEAGLERLDRGDIDCVVSDYDMPEASGIEFLEVVRDRWPELPFVLFTGKGSEEVASDAITAGVTDYLQKRTGSERYALLANRVRNAVERNRSQRELEERKRRLETLISNLPGIVYRCANEPGWPMEYVAGECEDLIGYSAAAIQSGDVSWGEDVIYPVDRRKAWETVQEAMANDEPFEFTYRVVDAGGELRWVWERGRAVRDGDGEVATLEGFITDITERKRHEQDLREQREFTEAIFDALDDVVYVFDDEGRALWWNDRAAEVTGYSTGELAGMHPTDFVADEDADLVREAMTEVLESGRSQVAVDLVCADGSTVAYDFRGRALTDENGESWGFCGIGRDVSDRQAYERELEARNRRLDQFASVVSHDLRSPLNVAQGRLAKVREECDSDQLDAVESAHDRMHALIDDLLLMARSGDRVTDREAVSLAECARTAWSHVDTADATLVAETDRVVEADVSRLQELFENLFRNAVEHGSTSPRSETRGDAVEHGTDDADATDLTVRVGDCPGGFFVADDGVGVPPDERDQVLELGYSTTESGAGLGLGIVAAVADAHGWDLAVTEAADGGARFEFTGVGTD